MKVVFDTNILISATLWDDSVAQKLLFRLISYGAEIFSSAEIIDEYINVLKRDFEYANKEIVTVVNKILSFVSIVIPLTKLDAVKDDPDDNKIIECSVDSSSDYIIKTRRSALSSH